jgi:hypothetical protein
MQTTIYKRTGDSERVLGYTENDTSPDGLPLSAGLIFRRHWDAGIEIGRYDETGHVFRRTTYDEKLVGHVTGGGAIFSSGLFEGGELGWVDPDGVVVQGGFMLGEEEVGRVDGPQPNAAAAALLLIFLPEEAEEDRRMNRQIP